MRRKRIIVKLLLLLGGLYATGMGLWRLGCSAIFAHEAVVIPGVVVDVRERPFEDITEMLAHGNLPWEGSVAHQPHVRYEFAGLSRVDHTLPDLDNHDYNRGEAVEIILHPQQPHQRHINKFKFVWGEHLLMLGLGVLMLLVFRLSSRRRKAHRKAPRREPTIVVQLPATVAEPTDEAPTPAKKRRRTTKPKDPAAATVKPRKTTAKSKDTTAAPKKRRRKAKTAADEV